MFFAKTETIAVLCLTNLDCGAVKFENLLKQDILY